MLKLKPVVPPFTSPELATKPWSKTGSSWPERGPGNYRAGTFEVRRFAGACAHVGHIERLRVAHLTDLHVGRVTPMKVQHEAVRIANESHPDLVVLTGDFVCHSQLYLDALEEIVGSFEAPVVCVMGNHDYWSGVAGVRRALRRAGAEVLDNQSTTITLRHQELQLVGLDDAYTGHADVQKAVKGLRRELPTLGLSHIAEEADALWHAGVPLVLSGHTHAGQVTLARLHELAVGRIAGHKYVHGLYGERAANSRGAVYVGAGVGAAIVPLRLGERGRREVTFFELGERPGAFAEHHTEQPALTGRKPSAKRRYLRHAAVAQKERRRNLKNERR